MKAIYIVRNKKVPNEDDIVATFDDRTRSLNIFPAILPSIIPFRYTLLRNKSQLPQMAFCRCRANHQPVHNVGLTIYI